MDKKYEAPEHVAEGGMPVGRATETSSNQIIADESAKNNAEIDAGDTAFEYDAETDTLSK